MSLLVAVKGFVLALSTIMPIGSQNALILKQGMHKNYHRISAGLFIFYDALLITLGVLAGSLLLTSNIILFNLLTWGGIIFLLIYGFIAFKNALYLTANNTKIVAQSSLKRVVIIGLFVTFVNPHVYIDTVMIIGSVGGQYKNGQQYYFIIGAIFASLVWFSTLAFTAAKLSKQLCKPKVQRVVDSIIGLIMWSIATLLFLTWLEKQ